MAMGWKINAILIRAASLPGEGGQFLSRLGFRGAAPLGERRFGEVCGSRGRSIWIGRAGDSLILSGRVLAEPFFEPQPSRMMVSLFAFFPSAEIGAVILESAVNGWGYAVFDEGRPLRRRRGDGDAGVVIEEGPSLPEESALLGCASRAGDGRRLYHLPELPGETLEEDEVGENFVFAILRRFTGPGLTDEALLEAPMQGFEQPLWRRLWS
jgi:hypothetical protein